MSVEVCAEDIESAKIACRAGADRIEVCSALDIGGVTPSLGAVRSTQRIASSHGVHVTVLIRPRSGDFVYSPQEIEIMIDDIKTFKALGIHGVAIGAINGSGRIDTIAMQRMILAAEPLEITFHRAFDFLEQEIKESIDVLADLRVNRILTSGRRASACQGIDMIRSAQELARDIVICAAGGINTLNVQEIGTSFANMNSI